MKLHFAGSDGIELHNAVLRTAGAVNRLESYYTHREQGSAPSTGFTMLLDSGGFSARTRGVTIDVVEYAAFVAEHGITECFNLDTLSPEETEEHLTYLVGACPETTVLPVWHATDWPNNKTRLGELVEQFDYIGIGALVGGPTPKARKQQALDWVFGTFRTSVRFHGLGVTSVGWLQRYPWFSVDSTSWLAPGRYGSRQGDPRLAKFENKTYAWHERNLQAVRELLELERRTTRLWLGRGVDWSTHERMATHG